MTGAVYCIAGKTRRAVEAGDAFVLTWVCLEAGSVHPKGSSQGLVAMSTVYQRLRLEGAIRMS